LGEIHIPSNGHGADEDGLVFEDIDGQFKLIEGEDLADLFDLFSDRLVIASNALFSTLATAKTKPKQSAKKSNM